MKTAQWELLLRHSDVRNRSLSQPHWRQRSWPLGPPGETSSIYQCVFVAHCSNQITLHQPKKAKTRLRKHLRSVLWVSPFFLPLHPGVSPGFNSALCIFSPHTEQHQHINVSPLTFFFNCTAFAPLKSTLLKKEATWLTPWINYNFFTSAANNTVVLTYY